MATSEVIETTETELENEVEKEIEKAFEKIEKDDLLTEDLIRKGLSILGK